MKTVRIRSLARTIINNPWPSAQDGLLLSSVMLVGALLALQYNLLWFVSELSEPQRKISLAEAMFLAVLLALCIFAFVIRRLREARYGVARRIFDEVMWAFRCGFFRDCRDIARWDVQCELADALGVDINAIEKSIHDGTAFARLATDYQDADKMRIEGSPSFVLNEGRQKLYGDVGFRIIEANIQELLRTPGGDQASWCKGTVAPARLRPERQRAHCHGKERNCQRQQIGRIKQESHSH